MLNNSTEHPNDPECSAPAASDNFNAQAKRPYADAQAGLQQASHTLLNPKADISLEELEDAQKHLSEMALAVRKMKAARFVERMEDRIAPLSHVNAPNIGKQFIEAIETSGISVSVDENITCNAIYTSYSFAEQNRGFANIMAINPERADERDLFYLSVIHEYLHGFQKKASPALHCSPFNPDNRVVVHPADWIMLQLLCERDAFTKEALFARLMLDTNDKLAKASLIRPHEFDAAYARYNGSLANTVVSIALDSLARPHDRAHPRGKNYIQHYQQSAIKNFSAGMFNRKDEKQTDLIFVRLEMDDYWQVGNYGIGPNSFGEYVQEPLFATRHDLTPELKSLYDVMCKDYNIPPLEKCPTLREYSQSIALVAPQYEAAPEKNAGLTPRPF